MIQLYSTHLLKIYHAEKYYLISNAVYMLFIAFLHLRIYSSSDKHSNMFCHAQNNIEYSFFVC